MDNGIKILLYIIIASLSFFMFYFLGQNIGISIAIGVIIFWIAMIMYAFEKKEENNYNESNIERQPKVKKIIIQRSSITSILLLTLIILLGIIVFLN